MSTAKSLLAFCYRVSYDSSRKQTTQGFQWGIFNTRSSNYNKVLLATKGMQPWEQPLVLKAEAAQPVEEQIRKRGSHSPGWGSSLHGPRDAVFPEITYRWDSLGGLPCRVPGKVGYGRHPAVEVAGNQPLVGVMCQEIALGGGRSRLPMERVLLRPRNVPSVSLPCPLLVKPDMVPCGEGERCLCHKRGPW